MNKNPRFLFLAVFLLSGLFLYGTASAGDRMTMAAPAKPAATGASVRTPDTSVLAILDPMDVATGKTVPAYGDFLREQMLKTGRIRTLPRGEMEKKLAEFDWNPSKPCHEFQCGFDAGNVLLSQYVLFGTVTALEGLHAYTFNVLHVPSGQVIASEVGDVPRKPGPGGDEPLKAKLAAYAAALDPSRLDHSKRLSRGLMAVVDLSAASPQSRVMAERVGTHAYASRHYDLMSQLELQELLAAMNIPLSSFETVDSGMIALGSRLNVAFLVHSRLSGDSRGQKLDLALFDIAGKRRIRDWPSKPTADFEDLLHFENRFFTTLTGRTADLEAQGAGKPGKARHAFNWTRGLLSLAGLSVTAGLAAFAYSTHQDANATYALAEATYDQEEGRRWKRKTESKDKSTILSGSLAVLSLGATITLWTF